ncbi:NHL repeat-containing protein, partial [candidate division KSB1 bacterium]
MKIKITFFFIIFLSMLVISCSSGEDTYTTEIINGVNHVHNIAPLWGEEQGLSLEFVQNIGELESEDDNYLFYQPRDLEVDNEENIYILDRGNYRIQKFDRDGNYISTIGSKGEGPGEFLNCSSIQIDRTNNLLYVGDSSNGRINVFLLNGKYLREIKTTNMLRVFLLAPDEKLIVDELFYSHSRWVQNDNNGDIGLLGIYDLKGQFLKEFGRAIDYGKRAAIWDGNLFSYDLDDEGYIYTIFYRQNRIEKFSPEGNLIFTADRKLSFEPEITEKEIVTRGGDRIKTTVFTNISLGLALDSMNRIWTSTLMKKNSSFTDPDIYKELCFEIYNESGILLQRLPVPVNFSYIEIFGNYMYLIDSIEKMCVYK